MRSNRIAKSSPSSNKMGRENVCVLVSSSLLFAMILAIIRHRKDVIAVEMPTITSVIRKR